MFFSFFFLQLFSFNFPFIFSFFCFSFLQKDSESDYDETMMETSCSSKLNDVIKKEEESHEKTWGEDNSLDLIDIKMEEIHKESATDEATGRTVLKNETTEETI